METENETQAKQKTERRVSDDFWYYLAKGLDWANEYGLNWVPNQLNLLEQLGHLERKDKHYKKALSIYLSHRDLIRKTYGEGKRRETYMDAYLCLTYMYMGNCDQSKEAFWESMRIFFPDDKNLRPLTHLNLDSLKNLSRLFWSLNTELP